VVVAVVTVEQMEARVVLLVVVAMIQTRVQQVLEVHHLRQRQVLLEGMVQLVGLLVVVAAQVLLVLLLHLVYSAVQVAQELT
jgi:hypothetical protein